MSLDGYEVFPLVDGTTLYFSITKNGRVISRVPFTGEVSTRQNVKNRIMELKNIEKINKARLNKLKNIARFGYGAGKMIYDAIPSSRSYKRKKKKPKRMKRVKRRGKR